MRTVSARRPLRVALLLCVLQVGVGGTPGLAAQAEGRGSPGAARPSAGGGNVTAFWANDGGDKVTRDELRTRRSGRPILNRLWDGRRVRLFGARNEVVAFNMVLEAAGRTARGVDIRFAALNGPKGYRIGSAPARDRGGLFRWTGRDIELFLVRYLQIKGISRLSYETYDERHIPERLQRPRGAAGNHVGGWRNRPDHDKFYPDIAVPLELSPRFSIKAGQNQSIWADIYIPKAAPPGTFKGTVTVSEAGVVTYRVPVELEVRNFTLPDVPASKTMVATSASDIARRYTGVEYPNRGSPEDRLTKRVMDRQFQVSHRHKVSLIEGDMGEGGLDRPSDAWIPRLSGKLFTAANGYKGPGVGIGNNVYAIGTFGTWRNSWRASRAAIWDRTDRWEAWFRRNFRFTERFLYLIDESPDHAQTQKWARWMRDNPGIGRHLPSFATVDLLDAQRYLPSLGISASWISTGDDGPWQRAADRVRADRTKRLYMYNGKRPASGSFAIEDDGVALRQLPWGQHKKGVGRWFFWQATYYNDYQGGRGDTNVFETAQTFGGPASFDATYGMSGWNSSNGDGVLFYPGTDRIFRSESYGLEGPIASLRLKHWRRGIQDVDYLRLAAAKDPAAVRAVVGRMVPKALWENGVDDRGDPTWVLCPISWSTDPDDWEAAREELAGIIDGR